MNSKKIKKRWKYRKLKIVLILVGRGIEGGERGIEEG